MSEEVVEATRVLVGQNGTIESGMHYDSFDDGVYLLEAIREIESRDPSRFAPDL